MKQIRLLPVVIVAALALLVLKGVGLVTQGGYVLTGVSVAEAAGAAGTGGAADGTTMALPSAPTLRDSVPTLDDGVPTLGLGGANEEAGGTGSAAASDVPAGPVATACEDVPAPETEGESTAAGTEVDPAEDCIPMAGVNEHGDAMPLTLDGAGNIVPLATQSGSESEEAILERLAERRGTLE